MFKLPKTIKNGGNKSNQCTHNLAMNNLKRLEGPHINNMVIMFERGILFF